VERSRPKLQKSPYVVNCVQLCVEMDTLRSKLKSFDIYDNFRAVYFIFVGTGSIKAAVLPNVACATLEHFFLDIILLQ
jgi:hypothetical protein